LPKALAPMLTNCLGLTSPEAVTIETRSWGTNYRGWLAIHASKAMPRVAEGLCYREPFGAALHKAMGPVILHTNLPLGAIVAVEPPPCGGDPAGSRWQSVRLSQGLEREGR
jgi:hypothetical protein